MSVVRIRCLFMVMMRAGTGESGFVRGSVCVYDCRLDLCGSAFIGTDCHSSQDKCDAFFLEADFVLL